MKKLLFATLLLIPLVNSFSAMAIEIETICCKTTSSGQKFCRLIVSEYGFCPMGWQRE